MKKRTISRRNLNLLGFCTFKLNGEPRMFGKYRDWQKHPETTNYYVDRIKKGRFTVSFERWEED